MLTKRPLPSLCWTCVCEEECDQSPAHKLGGVLGEKGWRIWGCSQYKKRKRQ